MSIEGKRIKAVCGTVGRVYAVALGEFGVQMDPEKPPYRIGSQRVTGFLGLLCKDDGTFTTVSMEGAVVFDERQSPYVPPPPTAMPGPGVSGR